MEVMASEGGSGDVAATSAPAVSAATTEPNSVEKYTAGGNQGHAHQYYPLPAGSTSGEGSLQNVSYQYNLQNVQDGSSASTSAATATDAYSGYSYSTSTNQYVYGSSEYTNCCSSYQQQPNQSYHQAPGAYQNPDNWSSLHRKQLRLESRQLYNRLLSTLCKLWPRHKQCI